MKLSCPRPVAACAVIRLERGEGSVGSVQGSFRQRLVLEPLQVRRAGWLNGWLTGWLAGLDWLGT